MEEETLGKVEVGVAAFVRLAPKMVNIASIPGSFERKRVVG